MPNERKNSDFLGRDQSFNASGSEDANLQSKGENESDGKTQSPQRVLTQYQNSRSTALETPLTNIALSHKLIAELYGLGVTEWIVCAGARNAPLIKTLNLYRSAESSEDSGSEGGLGDKVCRREERRGEKYRREDYRGDQLTVIHFFEERSAGFFAIGRAKRSGAPVAVLTTSGTAVAELLPAMMEATYSGIPLVMVSADRPSSYWGTGAPQTVWQPGIFTSYSNPTICWDCHQQPPISLVADLADITGQPLKDISRRRSSNRPSHINISFDEPLLDVPVETGYVPLRVKVRCALGNLTPNLTANATGNFTGNLTGYLTGYLTGLREDAASSGDSVDCLASPLDSSPEDIPVVVAGSTGCSSTFGVDAENVASQISQFQSASSAPLVLLAALTPDEAAIVKPHLLRLRLPIYAEAHSQLREDPELAAYIIRCGEGLFNQWPQPRSPGKARATLNSVSEEFFDSVIRIGGIPTTRLWRNLEGSLSDWPVLSFSSLPFSGLARLQATPPLPLEALESLGLIGEWDLLEQSFGPKKEANHLKNNDKIWYKIWYHVPKKCYHVPAAASEIVPVESPGQGSESLEVEANRIILERNLAASDGPNILKSKDKFRYHVPSVAVPSAAAWVERGLRASEQANHAKSNDKIRYHVPKTYAEGLSRLLAQYPQSEPGWIRRISRVVPVGSMVFLGNSLPIREWDLAAEYPEHLGDSVSFGGVSCGGDSSGSQLGHESTHVRASQSKRLTILGNRGVNGIDGLVSTFLGAAQPNRENWLILGDLSAAYDLAGLGLIDHLPQTTIRIVLINNGGGMIFNRLFKDPAFENRHQILFKPWAEMFGIDYRRNEELESPHLPQRALIEIVPDHESTDSFWNSYEELFR